MKDLTKKELKVLRAWVKSHADYTGDMHDGCCCSLVGICKHHADRQNTYAKQLPPQTMRRLLDENESLREQNERLKDEIRRFRSRVVM